MNDFADQKNSGLIQKLKQFWPLILIAVLFLIEQWPVFLNWWKIWEEKDGYYSHGILVPFIAIFMLWTNRNKFARAKIVPCMPGLILLIASLPIYALGIIMGLRLLFGVGFFLCVFGIMLTVFGKHITKIAAIPIFFLVTMIPLASSVLDTLTLKAQLTSTTVAAKFLQIAFPDHTINQMGNQIYSSSLPGGILLVGVPCSGLRLLISLITFTWFFIYVIRGVWWKKTILMLLSLPLAVFINSLRIAMIGSVGFWTESSASMHAFHDYSGYIGLVICFVLLFAIAKLLRTGELNIGESNTSEFSSRKPYANMATIVAVAVVLVAGIAISSLVQPFYDYPKGHLYRTSIPKSFGNWISQDLPIDKKSKAMLAKGDLLSRQFTEIEGDARQVQVYMTAGLDNTSFHDPHLCLPGGGTPLTDDQFITIKFEKPRPITVKASLLTASGNYDSLTFIYWYMLGDKSFPRTDGVFQDTRMRKVEDFKRLVTHPWAAADIKRDILTRQYTWFRFSTAGTEVSDRKFLISFIKDFVAHNENFGK